MAAELSREERRAARKRAHEMAERIEDARRRGYVRLLRREIEALRALVRGAKQGLESFEFGSHEWDAHLGVYCALERELTRREYDLAFWLGDKATQREIKEQNPWL